MMRLIAGVLFLFAQALSAQPFVLPAQPDVAFRQNLGQRLPLEERLLDEADHPVRLSDFFGAAPVVLVLGYYRCPNLCETAMASVLRALVAMPASVPYTVVAVSIDPRETAATVTGRKAAYEALDSAGAKRLHLLRGSADATARIAHAAGFRYTYERSLDQYIHAAGFLVASADGRIARYFLGVAHDPRDVRLALIEAAAGHTGSLADRLLLVCSHFDPVTGRYSVAVMNVVRGVSLAVVAVLAAWLWRRRAKGRA